MKSIKKLVVLLLVIALACSLFAGCGANSGDSKDTSGKSSVASTTGTASVAEDPLKDHVELTIAYWDIGQAIPDGVQDKFRDTIFNKFNVTIKPMNITWEDYVDKISLWAASSQLPDVFAIDAVGTKYFNEFVTQNVVRALPDDMSAYPNLNKILTSDWCSSYKYPLGDSNGKYYGIPRLNHPDADSWANDSGIQVRKDWMENVGITKDPETMDEFITLMKAFVEQDPDKNGKKDTIGLTVYNARWFGPLLLGYEPGAVGDGQWVKDEENPGKWIPSFMTKDFLEGMKALKKLYDAGGLDKDFASFKAEEGADKMAQGKAGAYAHGGDPGSLKSVAEKYEKVNSGKKYEDVVRLLKPLKHYRTGEYYRYIQNGAWSETYFNSKLDDKKLDRFLRIYDYYLSDDGYNFVHYGFEGEDWHKEGDTIVLTPKKNDKGDIIPLTTTYPFSKIGGLAEWSGTRIYTAPFVYPNLQKISSEMNDWWKANAKPMATDIRIPFIEYASKDKANQSMQNDITQLILSKDVEATWNKMVEKYRKNGYDKVIADMNAEAAKLGITPK